MKAVYARAFGGDDPLANLEIGDLPEPTAGPGLALVRLSHAALNHHDLWTLRGVSSQSLGAPLILGCDGVGTVEACGGPASGAPAPAPGTRVLLHAMIHCGECGACRNGDFHLCKKIVLLSDPPWPGTLAEKIAVPLANLLPLPENVDDEAAVCLPTAYLTAYHMLFARAHLRPGMSVLVQGASGGVATACILLAKAAGITVYATSRSAEKREAAEKLGACKAFALDREAGKALQSMSDGGVDAVVDTVGEATWDFSLRAVRSGGTIVVAGATSGDGPPASLRRVFWRHLNILGSTMGTRQELQRLIQLCSEGVLQPLVGGRWPLEKAKEAFAQMEAGGQNGKIVIAI